MKSLVQFCQGTSENEQPFGNMPAKRPTIYRVPDHLRNLNANAYTPWHVSIGPYHHKHEKYKVIEEHKLAYMQDLICHATITKNHKELTYSEKSKVYNEEALKMASTARNYYAETIHLNDQELAKMLLIDGCFIVEFLCRKIQKLYNVTDEPTRRRNDHQKPDQVPLGNGFVGKLATVFGVWEPRSLQSTRTDIDFDQMYEFINSKYRKWKPEVDFIFRSTRTSFEVRRDLTLLENQLPYFVIERFFELTFKAYKRPPDFSEIVYCAMRTSIPNITHLLSSEEVQRIIKGKDEVAHLVSFLKIICGTPKILQQENREEGKTIQVNIEGKKLTPAEPTCLCTINGKATNEFRVPNAARLAKAGIRFRMSESPLLEIKFNHKDGVLEMPVLIMWHHTETFFRNVMAYELYNHSTDGNNRTVSDYMCFMDDLINTKEDVKQLVKHGIIQNWLESDDAVADLFNSVTKHILANYSSYSDTCKNLNKFCSKTIRKWVAVLRQDYFNQPWAVTYFITGVVIQTAAAIINATFNIKNDK